MHIVCIFIGQRRFFHKLSLYANFVSKMSNQIISQVLGQLTQDQKFPDWWKIDSVTIPFFDNVKLPVTFMDFVPEDDKDFVKEADSALNSFLGKSILDRNLISDILYKNCLEILAEWDNNHIQAQLGKLSK
jgi:hypothetical protein